MGCPAGNPQRPQSVAVIFEMVAVKAAARHAVGAEASILVTGWCAL
ncbi:MULTISPECIES: hypothetical protein [unclassified Rhizobium]|nr:MULTISPECIES: hypothetical protein [unclassified Rhizobium]QXZ88423.1 hypothetical protein J5280_09665 [Rhizobium sp. K15/93]